jgi:hypothetical protein
LGTQFRSISHYNQSGSSPGPAYTGSFSDNTKHYTYFPSSKEVIYGSHSNVTLRRAAAIFRGEKKFVVTKDNYGDRDYKFD